MIWSLNKTGQFIHLFGFAHSVISPEPSGRPARSCTWMLGEQGIKVWIEACKFLPLKVDRNNWVTSYCFPLGWGLLQGDPFLRNTLSVLYAFALFSFCVLWPTNMALFAEALISPERFQQVIFHDYNCLYEWILEWIMPVRGCDLEMQFLHVVFSFRFLWKTLLSTDQSHTQPLPPSHFNIQHAKTRCILTGSLPCLTPKIFSRSKVIKNFMKFLFSLCGWLIGDENVTVHSSLLHFPGVLWHFSVCSTR